MLWNWMKDMAVWLSQQHLWQFPKGCHGWGYQVRTPQVTPNEWRLTPTPFTFARNLGSNTFRGRLRLSQGMGKASPSSLTVWSWVKKLKAHWLARVGIEWVWVGWFWFSCSASTNWEWAARIEVTSQDNFIKSCHLGKFEEESMFYASLTLYVMLIHGSKSY